jgi:hypothetical protein
MAFVQVGVYTKVVGVFVRFRAASVDGIHHRTIRISALSARQMSIVDDLSESVMLWSYIGQG